ncbi:hypothetical protein ACFJIS_18910 [Variovorax boronicumulans]|uniref:hypothetical protein n=1 Tax=Variovorax boronicumulans TaxID=436515 RepID=UPI0036F39C77
MAKALSGERSYRCFYTPTDRFGVPVATDTGVLPYVQVKADDAEGAQRAAHHATGCPVSSVERLEHAEA